jgi:predicted DNA-binding transcriptional regulator AlpA
MEVVMEHDVHGAFTVREWCQYRGICPATFYNRLPYGEMPATLKIGRRTIITVEADEEWRRRMEKLPAQAMKQET